MEKNFCGSLEISIPQTRKDTETKIKKQRTKKNRGVRVQENRKFFKNKISRITSTWNTCFEASDCGRNHICCQDTQSKTHSAIINIKHADHAEEPLSVDTLLTKTAQATTAKSCDPCFSLYELQLNEGVLRPHRVCLYCCPSFLQ